MADQVQELIAKKNFPKAIELLRAQSGAKPHDRRLKLQLADVLIMGGREKDATPVLLALADAEAQDGFAAKAIAILKRIEKVDPGRRDVEERLAKLIQVKRITAVVPRPTATSKSGMEFGFEEIDSSNDIQLGAGNAATPSAAEPVFAADPIPEVAAPTIDVAEPAVAAVAEPPLDIAAALMSAPEAPAAAEPTIMVTTETSVAEFDDSFAISTDEPQKTSGLSTPLFEGFSEEELVAVMRGLKLVSFESGDIIVGEGAPGKSMFILTSGRVKAYVRKKNGEYVKVQEFEEGDFFGEIAVLTGKPRTATLTAAENTDCLELDRETLDEITKTHPGVRELLKKFQAERAKAAVQVMLKG